MSTLCLHCYLRYISGFLATQHSAQVQPTPVEFTSFKQSKSITNCYQHVYNKKSKLKTLKQLLPWKHLQSLLGYKTVADQKTLTPRVGRHFLYETVSNPSMHGTHRNYREMSQNFIAKNIPEETLIYIYYIDHDVNEKSPFTCWWVTVVNSYGGYGVYSYGNSCQSPRVSKDTRFLRTQNRMWLHFQ